jgi:hypothetical protein
MSRIHLGVIMSDGGKGSAPRPFSVSQQEWDDRYTAIFSKNKKTNTQESEATSLDVEDHNSPRDQSDSLRSSGD